MGGTKEPFDHVFPRIEVGPAGPDVQQIDDLLIQTFPMKDQRNLIDATHILCGKHGRHFNVAEEGNLRFDRLGEKILRPAQKDVRLDADLPKGLDAVLRRFRLHLARCLDEGNPGQMDEDGVLPTGLVAELTDGLEKRQALDVAHGPADLHDRHVEPLRRFTDVLLDLVRNVRNDLNGLAQIVPPPLLGDDREIDLPGREVVLFAHPCAGEAFVMAEIEVRLRPVVGHENLPVLKGAHRPRIDIDVGVQLLVGHPEAAAFENGRNGRRRQPLAERREHPSRHKNEFCLHCHPLQSPEEDLPRFRLPRRSERPASFDPTTRPEIIGRRFPTAAPTPNPYPWEPADRDSGESIPRSPPPVLREERPAEPARDSDHPTPGCIPG